MVKVVQELKAELTKIDNDHYYRFLFDDNMNIFVHPSLIKKNEKGQDIVDFFNTELIIKETPFEHYYIIQPDNIKHIKVLSSGKPLEIEIKLCYESFGYYFEFKSKGKYYYFIYGGYKGFTFRLDGVLYTVKNNKIKEIREYTPTEEFKVSL